MKSNKGMGGHHSAKSRTNDWITPREILMQLGEFDLDPCASLYQPWPTAKVQYTINDDGLSKHWHRIEVPDIVTDKDGNEYPAMRLIYNPRVWLNPPYSIKLIRQFMEKMARHNNGIALTFARTDTGFFHDFIFPVASSLLFIKRRVEFCNTGGIKAQQDGGAPSVLIAYGQENSDILASTKIIGR